MCENWRAKVERRGCSGLSRRCIQPRSMSALRQGTQDFPFRGCIGGGGCWCSCCNSNICNSASAVMANRPMYTREYHQQRYGKTNAAKRIKQRDVPCGYCGMTGSISNTPCCTSPVCLFCREAPGFISVMCQVTGCSQSINYACGFCRAGLSHSCDYCDVVWCEKCLKKNGDICCDKFVVVWRNLGKRKLD